MSVFAEMILTVRLEPNPFFLFVRQLGWSMFLHGLQLYRKSGECCTISLGVHRGFSGFLATSPNSAGVVSIKSGPHI